jgi:hypothetical protein
MSHDELSALKVLQQARNTANYQTKRANGTNKKREKNRTPSEESQQENTHEHNSTAEDSLSEPNQVDSNQEHRQAEQKQEHTSTTEQIQSESNLAVLQEVEKQIDNDYVPENKYHRARTRRRQIDECAYSTEYNNPQNHPRIVKSGYMYEKVMINITHPTKPPWIATFLVRVKVHSKNINKNIKPP